MQTLSLAMRNSEEEGIALPSVFPSLERIGVKFRRSQLSLIAAAPGGGKSAFATYEAVHAAYGEFEESPVPTLYFSADTDKKTLGSRITASVTRLTVDEAEIRLDSHEEKVWNTLEQNTNHIWFCWDRGPSIDDLEMEVQAFAHVMGDWPHKIVVDNLKNIWVEESGEGGEHIRYDRVLDWLHQLAGITGAHVMVLHHVTGYYETGNMPIPLSGILGKVTKPFGLILTMYKAWDNMLGLCVVKNRTGRAEADGSHVIYMPYDLERMQFIDKVQEQNVTV
jgi:hypothetical protein